MYVYGEYSNHKKECPKSYSLEVDAFYSIFENLSRNVLYMFKGVSNPFLCN